MPQGDCFISGVPASNIPICQPLLQGRGVNGVHRVAQEAPTIQLAQDGRDAAGAVDIFHVVVVVVRRNF